jgi:outer membrane protein
MDRTRTARHIALCLALLALAGNRVASGAEVSLQAEDLPRILAERNQNVRGASLLLESSRTRTGHLVRSFLPSLEVQGGGETFQTNRYPTLTQPYGAVEARINLFRGGRDLLEDRARDAQVSAAEAQARRTGASELIEARRAYWTLVFQREEIATLKEALAENARNLASAQRRISRGLTTDTDRLDFEINRSELQEQIASLTHETELTETRLAALLGMTEGTTFLTSNRIPHEHDEKLVSAPLEAAPQYDVGSLRAQAEAARSEAAQAGRWWLPTVDAYGGYYLYTTRDRDFLDSSLRNDTAVGVRLSLTLFDGLQARNAAASAGLRTEALEQQTAQQERTVRARWKIAQEEMKHTHELTHESEKRVQQGKAYLAKTLAEYDRGVKNSPDVLGASLRFLSFRRRYAEIRRDYQLAKADLLAIAGK